MAWLAGIVIGQATPLSTLQWLTLTSIALAATIAFRHHHIHKSFFAILMIIFLGASRLQGARPSTDSDHIASYNDTGRKVSITGVVVRPPDVRDTYTGLRLSVESLRFEDGGGSQTVHGLVLLRASRFGDWAYGDRLRVDGILETPPVFETFSYRDYLARQGVHSLMPYASCTQLATRQAKPVLQLIFDYRARGLETVYALFPDPEASLLAGILLGVESGISPEVRQSFNQTGTTHIIAISGFNITIISSFFIALFGRWFGIRRGAIAACVSIAIYTILVGADAAVVRAAFMGGLALLARHLGRQAGAIEDTKRQGTDRRRSHEEITRRIGRYCAGDRVGRPGAGEAGRREGPAGGKGPRRFVHLLGIGERERCSVGSGHLRP